MIDRMMIVHWTLREWSCPPDTAASAEERSSPRNEEDSTVPTEECSHSDEETAKTGDDRWKNDGNDAAELLLPILFYYDAKHTKDEFSNRRSMLQFAGASHALYHLPQTILPLVITSDNADVDGNDDGSQSSPDRTKVVHFDAATAWVFVPLDPLSSQQQEERRTVDIVAIVQIKTSEVLHSTAATPTAVSHSLQRAYRLFSLLRRGSIHERLLHPLHGKNGPQQKDSEVEYYPGMDQLYRWYQNQHRREPFNADSSQLQNLPYTLLRRDLEYHFKDWIMNCHHCRNIIECIPSPISNATDDSTLTSSGISFPAEIDPNIVHTLDSALNDLCRMNDGSLPQLLGMSFFMQNQLVTMSPSSSLSGNNHVINTSKGLALPNESAILLHQYMTQMQYQMTKPSSDAINPPERKKGISLRLPSFARSFLKDDSMRLPPANGTQLPAFLPPPPLSILNVVEDTASSAFVCDNETVWAPPVALTLADETTVSARVALFSHDKLHALIYLSRVLDDEPKEAYQSLLTEISSVLYRVVDALVALDRRVATGRDDIDDPELHRSWDTMDGFDMIAVDRSLDTSTVYIDEVDPKIIATLPHVSFPLDDRYVLLYHLSSDTLLAFEDAIDEVLRYRENVRDNNDPSKRPPCFERCTLLRKHWVYCHAEREKELYLLLHTSHFVTMADVQRVVQQLRKQFWNEPE
jgi:hypothetical protein